MEPRSLKRGVDCERDWEEEWSKPTFSFASEINLLIFHLNIMERKSKTFRGIQNYGNTCYMLAKKQLRAAVPLQPGPLQKQALQELLVWVSFAKTQTYF